VLIRLQQAPILLYNEGLAYARAGDFDRAMLRMQESIAAFPDNPSAYVVLGKLYAQQGRLDLARNTWIMLLERWPDEEAARQGIAAGSEHEKLRQKEQAKNRSAQMKRRRFELAWSFVIGGAFAAVIAILVVQFEPTNRSSTSVAWPTPTAIAVWTPMPSLNP